MKTCITLHPHEIARCPGPVTLLRPVLDGQIDMDDPIPFLVIDMDRGGEKRFEKKFQTTFPYGRVGDVLLVRETWRRFSARDECSHYDDCDCARNDGEVLFYDGSDRDSHWRSPVTMPAALARYQFTVEGIGAKRANKLTTLDVHEAGYNVENPSRTWLVVEHGRLQADWDREYPHSPWASNPLLWVIRGNVEARR